MQTGRTIEFAVGVFIIVAMASLVYLAFKVSGLAGYYGKESYHITAAFTNIGGLKERAAVKMAGVELGEVTAITLNRDDYQAQVTMQIYGKPGDIPIDSSAKILTAGLLGANYIGLTPGFEDTFLQEGDTLDETYPAVILENLIGQLVFSNKGNKDEK